MNEGFNFKINNNDDSQPDLNCKKKYLFRRTYFVLDDSQFVELLALMIESTRSDNRLLEKHNNTLATASRERHFSDVSEGFAQTLITKQVINEVIEMNKNQFDYLMKAYKDDDLFLVTKEIVDTIN